MRQEAIRAFRQSWKPKRKHTPMTQPRAVSRPPLVTLPRQMEPVIPRVSLLNPMPPPSVAALRALGDSLIPGSGSGVRRRPQRDGELEALSELAEECKIWQAPIGKVPPPLPDAARRRTLIALAPQPVPPALRNRMRNSREPTDPHIEILASYVVPPLPAQVRAREAIVHVEASSLTALEAPAPQELPSKSRLRALAAALTHVWFARQLGMRLISVAALLCVCALPSAHEPVRFSRQAMDPLVISSSVPPVVADLHVAQDLPPPAEPSPLLSAVPRLTPDAILNGTTQPLFTPARLDPQSRMPSAMSKRRHVRTRRVRSYYDLIGDAP